MHSYPGQYHAFSQHNGAHYNAAAAALANSRTSEFLHQQFAMTFAPAPPADDPLFYELAHCFRF
jgi:hypothetical protein